MPYFVWMLIPLVLTWMAIESTPFNEVLGTVPLTSGQWAMAALLSLIVFVVMEALKAARRRRRR